MAPHKASAKSKKQKCRVDRISGLPDEVLSQILSHLPGDQLIRTSIVSKQWNSLWLSVPTIDLDDSNNANTLLMKRSFMDSVDSVLIFNNISSLRKLHLSCHQSYHLSRVCEWIRAVIDLDLEEINLAFNNESQLLDIDFHGNKPVSFPDRLFTCKKLVSLKLMDSSTFIVDASPSVDLPCLKILHLHKILFSNDDSFENLIDGCPVLEELDIITKSDTNMSLFIRSSSLKRLRVNTEHACNFFFITSDSRVVVDAPHIETLDIKHHSLVEYDITSTPSLVKLKLHLCDECIETVIKSCGETLLELLGMISTTTKYLFLSHESLKWIKSLNTWRKWRSGLRLPVFCNLEHLELESIDYSWQVLCYLFERLPNLRTFVFHKERTRSRRCLEKFEMEEEYSLQFLECIELTGFRGIDDELKMVSYFVKTAPVLKIISIQSDYVRSKCNTKIVRNTLRILKGSGILQFTFNGNNHKV